MDTIPFPSTTDSSNATSGHTREQTPHNKKFPEYKTNPSGGILSKLSVSRVNADDNDILSDRDSPNPDVGAAEVRTSPKKATSRAMAVAVQQQKTRRRKGSLRKAALLGRGAQREKKDARAVLPATGYHEFAMDGVLSPTPTEIPSPAFALGIPSAAASSLDESAGNIMNMPLPMSNLPMGTQYHLASPPMSASGPDLSYHSTTDEEDILSIPSYGPSLRGVPQTSSSSMSHLPPGLFSRRRSSQNPKSPLSIGGLDSTALPPLDDEWDYSETEWWGWVVLLVTWVVFVIGMGSCLGVWSWAWDVGETPYAPPELEDDPTLPIVGYYPALIILTAVMAWVWVVVAWVGMKYFRHARISGD